MVLFFSGLAIKMVLFSSGLAILLALTEIALQKQFKSVLKIYSVEISFSQV